MRCSSFAALRVVRSRAARFMPIAKVVGAGLLVSACATSHASYENRYNVGMQPAQVAAAVPPKVELEDDGLAVQAPPRVRRNAEPDDPSEPFSPNYGPAPEPGESASEPVKGPSQPEHKADAVPVILRSRVTPMSPEEAQAIIVQAMIAHEKRNP